MLARTLLRPLLALLLAAAVPVTSGLLAGCSDDDYNKSGNPGQDASASSDDAAVTDMAVPSTGE